MNYLAFGWGPHTHNSIGGWDHYVGSGNNAAEGKIALLEAISDNEGMSDEIHFGHVIELETGNVVYYWSKYNTGD